MMLCVLSVSTSLNAKSCSRLRQLDYQEETDSTNRLQLQTTSVFHTYEARLTSGTPFSTRADFSSMYTVAGFTMMKIIKMAKSDLIFCNLPERPLFNCFAKFYGP